MRKILRILPIFLVVVGISISCQSNGETTGKTSYESKYEYVVDMPGTEQGTIYDAISFWLNSEFNEKIIGIRKFNSNGRDSGIFSYSLKNIAIEKQRQVGPFGGWWLAVDMTILIQTKPEKYKISWEDIKVYRITVNGSNNVLERKLQTKISREAFKNLMLIFEKKSYSLKKQIERINQDW